GKQIVLVSAADIGVGSREPTLFDLFVEDLFLRPEGCLIGQSLFVDRHRMKCIANAFTERSVVKLILAGESGNPVLVKYARDTQRTDRIPYPHEMDAHGISISRRRPECLQLLVILGDQALHTLRSTPVLYLFSDICARARCIEVPGILNFRMVCQFRFFRIDLGQIYLWKPQVIDHSTKTARGKGSA